MMMVMVMHLLVPLQKLQQPKRNSNDIDRRRDEIAVPQRLYRHHLVVERVDELYVAAARELNQCWGVQVL